MDFYRVFNGDGNLTRLLTVEQFNEEDGEIDASLPICIICQGSYDVRKDTYDWIPGGVPCCASSVHLSCLARWRFGNTNDDGSLVTSCPMCVSTYLPAVWFFERVTAALQDYVYREAMLEDLNNYDHEGIEALREHRSQAPVYFRELRRSPATSVQEFMRGEREKIERFILKSETAEKSEPGGVEKFIRNYTNARGGKYPGIPPLDASGDRIKEREEQPLSPQYMRDERRDEELAQQPPPSPALCPGDFVDLTLPDFQPGPSHPRSRNSPTPFRFNIVSDDNTNEEEIFSNGNEIGGQREEERWRGGNDDGPPPHPNEKLPDLAREEERRRQREDGAIAIPPLPRCTVPAVTNRRHEEGRSEEAARDSGDGAPPQTEYGSVLHQPHFSGTPSFPFSEDYLAVEQRHREEEEEEEVVVQRQRARDVDMRDQRQLLMKRVMLEKKRRAVDDGINRQLRNFSDFSAQRFTIASRELTVTENLMKKQEQAIRKLEKMVITRNKLLKTAFRLNRRHRQYPDTLTAASQNWTRNSNIVAKCLTNAKSASDDLKEEMRIKRLNLDTLERNLENEGRFTRLAEPVAFFNVS